MDLITPTGNRFPLPTWFPPTEKLEDWLKPLEGHPLTFRTSAAGRPDDVTLVPFYTLFGKRYALYWSFYDENEWVEVEAGRRARSAEEAARQVAIQKRLVDRVMIGEAESEEEHNLQVDKSSSGELRGEKWRQAANGGWFSYEMGAIPGQPLVLLCTYWGSDVGRTFDIFVEGTKIATQTVNVNFPGDFFDVEYKIPAELTQGKEKIRVSFQAPAEGTAGGVFGLVILKER